MTIRTRTYGYIEDCPRCFIENKACAAHCDPVTCPDPAHHCTCPPGSHGRVMGMHKHHCPARPA